MADIEKGEENTPHANDWEVLSLTASTYAAAPGPVQVEVNNNDESNMFEANEAKTSEPMLMSGHFDFPQRDPENFQMEAETMNICSTHENKDVISEVDDVGGVSKKKDDDNWNEIHFFNDEDNSLSFDDVEVKGKKATFEGLNLSEKELSFYKSEPSQGGSDSEISNLSISDKRDEDNGSEYPNEAWWKKQASALYVQAKEANAFWSVFVAATVMGLVILRQHWQLESWQVLQLRWHFSVSTDKMKWMLSPLSRIKDVIVGGNRRVFLPRSSSSTDN